MIKTALVAMTVLGCDCDAKVCEYIGQTPAQWSSVAECEAAMTAQVTRSHDLDYPLISGLCQTVPGAGSEMVAQPPVSDETGASIPKEPIPRESIP